MSQSTFTLSREASGPGRQALARGCRVGGSRHLVLGERIVPNPKAWKRVIAARLDDTMEEPQVLVECVDGSSAIDTSTLSCRPRPFKPWPTSASTSPTARPGAPQTLSQRARGPACSCGRGRPPQHGCKRLQ
jgi:hypothetical protein